MTNLVLSLLMGPEVSDLKNLSEREIAFLEPGTMTNGLAFLEIGTMTNGLGLLVPPFSFNSVMAHPVVPV